MRGSPESSDLNAGTAHAQDSSSPLSRRPVRLHREDMRRQSGDYPSPQDRLMAAGVPHLWTGAKIPAGTVPA